ncbi:hypothetical protein J2X87_004127 [Pseudomonas synxantha]|uniref:Uncharacterized protein n=1 Tax=Pseudomonas synxantha TaxID=47883 RepID=A0ACC6JRU2_9PSED|nr:hypothetical protein [Pseudomonas synxantha]
MSFFKAPESRDELGIGSVRDAISDQLFPGTSTIQTRLRYFFFIPWLYIDIETKGTTASRFSAAGREAEIRLMSYLDKNEPSNAWGITGRRSRSELKRLPSSVYWAALGNWGLRTHSESQQQHFARAERLKASQATRSRRVEIEYESGEQQGLWHPELKKLMPKGFPENAQLALTRLESEFLLDRWSQSHPDSLLTWLAVNSSPHDNFEEVKAIWEHPKFADFPDRYKALLRHCRRFDALIQGAARLYNLQLARLEQREDLIKKHGDALTEWESSEVRLLEGWSLPEFWLSVAGNGYMVPSRTQDFVTRWFAVVIEKKKEFGDFKPALDLIERRERELKGGRSRFSNKAARTSWGGEAGLNRLNYRWPIAQSMLGEWHEGFMRK